MSGYHDGFQGCGGDDSDSGNDDGGSSWDSETVPAEDVPGCDLHPALMTGCKLGEWIDRNIK
jgi:hypothetical protein